MVRALSFHAEVMGSNLTEQSILHNIFKFSFKLMYVASNGLFQIEIYHYFRKKVILTSVYIIIYCLFSELEIFIVGHNGS